MKTLFSNSEMRLFLLSTISRRGYYEVAHKNMILINADNSRYWLDNLGGLAGVW